MLGNYRVIDMTDERGQLCGHILRSLGAEVILVEPPGGSTARRVGPFAGGVQDQERSLRFWAHNRGKHSVVLDIADPAGSATLATLIDGADMLITNESTPALGFDPTESNPSLIHTTISPYGGTGPRSEWASSDLTIMAASGVLNLTGDHDRAPVRHAPAGQAHYNGAADAAGATLLALHERQHRSGLGQRIDVSAAQSFSTASIGQMLASPMGSNLSERSGQGLRLGGLDVRFIFPVADGYAIIVFLFGQAFAPFTDRLMTWIHEDGMVDDETRSKNWVDYTMMLMDGREPVSEYERCKRLIADWAVTKTKDELFAAALDRKLLIIPIMEIGDVVESPHFSARDFWDEVDHGELGSITYPGVPARLGRTPLETLGRAPHLGEHTEEVLNEARRTPAVVVKTPEPSTTLPLDGVKIVDLQWVMAGPATTRVMADYGADVIRVESIHRIDTARTLSPFRGNEADPEFSGLYGTNNAGKRDIALKLSDPVARDVLIDLVAQADIVLESYAAGAMDRWGLTYEKFKAVNPSIIVGSSSLLGQSGPHAALSGFGTMASSAAGLHYPTGWADRWPAGPFGAYTDAVSPRFYLAILLAALEHRRVTGEGQYIEMSQAEAAMTLLAPNILDYTINAQALERDGNNDPRFFPHAVYPAEGEDRWVAVACETDEQWRALAAIVGLDALVDLDVDQRRAMGEEIDGRILAWSSGLDPVLAAERLQDAGVPAYPVNDSAMGFNDPQLQHRQHFRQVTHATQPDGHTWVEGTRWVMSRTPAVIENGPPTIGEHTFEILTDVLGYDGDRIADLAAAEILE